MTWFSGLCWVLGVAMFAQAGLMALYAYEHRRFLRSRLRRPLDETLTPSVSLIVPCKGLELHLADHLAALFRLRYPSLEICFVVESASDPALPVIHMLRRKHAAVPSRVVIAGTATDCGQKVHNLIAAARTVTDESDILAFVDSDALPHADWLRRLVSRLQTGRDQIATGYRWYRPIEHTAANLALSALNNQVLVLLGPNPLNLAWGGAWAIRQSTFRLLGLPEAWKGTLSDDLVVSRLAHRAGVRIDFEPHCLSVSPASTTWNGLIEFARRQYRIIRVYQPRWWLSSFLSGLFTIGLLAGGVLLTCRAAVAGLAWWWPAGLLGGYLAATACRYAIQLNGVRQHLASAGTGNPESRLDPFRAVQRLNIWLWPVLVVGNWLLLASTMIGRTITWRGIGYRLDSPSRTSILNRPRSADRRNAA